MLVLQTVMLTVLAVFVAPPDGEPAADAAPTEASGPADAAADSAPGAASASDPGPASADAAAPPATETAAHEAEPAAEPHSAEGPVVGPAVPAPVDRDAPAPKRGDKKKKHKPKSRAHHKTGGFAVAPGIGFGLRTGGDKYCGEFSSDPADQDGRKPLCTGATPWSLDFTGMYGVFERLDVSLGLRLNLQSRRFRNDECPSDQAICDRGSGLFNNTLGFGIMPGVRIWGGNMDKIVKMGGAIDFFYMYESFAGYRNRPLAGDEDNDSQDSEDGVSDHMLGLRAGPILQIDPHHNVGIYLLPAAVPSFRPARDGFDKAGWFELAFEATLGIQARFP